MRTVIKRLPCLASKPLNVASKRLSNSSPAPFVYDHTTGKVPVFVCSFTLCCIRCIPELYIALGSQKSFVLVAKDLFYRFVILFLETIYMIFWSWRKVIFALPVADMADRKGRSVTFKTVHHLSLGVLKRAIDGEIISSIVVFQDLGNG